MPVVQLRVDGRRSADDRLGTPTDRPPARAGAVRGRRHHMPDRDSVGTPGNATVLKVGYARMGRSASTAAWTRRIWIALLAGLLLLSSASQAEAGIRIVLPSGGQFRVETSVESKSSSNVLAYGLWSPRSVPVCSNCVGGERQDLGTFSGGTELQRDCQPMPVPTSALSRCWATHGSSTQARSHVSNSQTTALCARLRRRHDPSCSP